MKPCRALSSHYSAFVDGELTALESVAIRKHLLGCSHCRQEVQELENMKLAVHIHGDSIPPSATLKHRLEQELERLERRRSRRVHGVVLATVTALSIIVVVGSPTNLDKAKARGDYSVEPLVQVDWEDDSVPTSPLAYSHQPRTRTMDDALFSDLIDRHNGRHKTPLSRHAGIVSFEALPIRLIDAGPQVRHVVNASYQRCVQTRSGASLAVLDATKIKLSPNVESSLDRIGFYVEHRDATEIRISQNGKRLFVLITDKSAAHLSVI